MKKVLNRRALIKSGAAAIAAPALFNANSASDAGTSFLK